MTVGVGKLSATNCFPCSILLSSNKLNLVWMKGKTKYVAILFKMLKQKSVSGNIANLGLKYFYLWIGMNLWHINPVVIIVIETYYKKSVWLSNKTRMLIVYEPIIIFL